MSTAKPMKKDLTKECRSQQKSHNHINQDKYMYMHKYIELSSEHAVCVGQYIAHTHTHGQRHETRPYSYLTT